MSQQNNEACAPLTGERVRAIEICAMEKVYRKTYRHVLWAETPEGERRFYEETAIAIHAHYAAEVEKANATVVQVYREQREALARAEQAEAKCERLREVVSGFLATWDADRLAACGSEAVEARDALHESIGYARAALTAPPQAAATETAESCLWSEDYDGIWEGDCGVQWCFEADGPKENQVRFCPRCGRPLVIAAAPEKGGAE